MVLQSNNQPSEEGSPMAAMNVKGDITLPTVLVASAAAVEVAVMEVAVEDEAIIKTLLT